MFDARTIKRMMKPSLRSLKRVALLKAYLAVGRLIKALFSGLKSEADERLMFNSQTLSLEAYLRLKFNDSSIEVLNESETTERNYIYGLNENQDRIYPRWLNEGGSPIYVYSLAEQLDNSLNYDFCVRCPIALQPFEADIKGVVQLMKLAGKRFKVEFV